MALSKITYANKSALNPQPSIADENKVTDANMNEIKSVVNNAIDQVDANTTNIGNITGTLLWTNPNPTSNFTSGNITLSSSNYDILEFVFRYSANSDARYFFVKTIKGHGAEVSCLINYNEGTSQPTEFPWRKVDYTDDVTYTVSQCFTRVTNEVAVPSTANNRLIPLYVIGYKTGLFN